MGTMSELARAVPYAREPRPGVISAGQPGPGAWRAVAAAGIATVLDIREDREPRGHDEPAAVEAAGLRYINIPFGHGRIPAAAFERVRAVMREAGDEPILVHCASGNRVGAALIPWWILDRGLTEDEAIQAAIDAGLASRGLAIAALEHVRRMRSEEEAAA
jgi:uncharacterized protein (TIGR01244 family)